MRKIILDTDLGDDIDDAFALQYLLPYDEIEILGITTVYKNVVERSKIAKKFVELYGKNIPVYAGENNPLRKKVRLLYGETVRQDGLIKIDHYTYDLDGVKYDGDNATDFILETLRKNPNEVTIVAIGPLTNLAKCVQKDNETFKLAKELLIMGGRFDDRVPEWNIETDTDGAKIVFGSGVPCKLVPFDATVRCTLTRQGVNKVRNFNGGSKEYLAKMMNRWIEHYDDNWKGEKIPILHDVLAVMELIDGNFLKRREIKFDLEISGENADCTVENANGEYSATLLYDFDQEEFYKKFWASLSPQN